MSLLAHDTYGEPKKPLIPFIVIHTFIFLLFFIVLSQLFYFGPGALELGFAENMLKGLVPYRDFPSEYPPLALLPSFYRRSSCALTLLTVSPMPQRCFFLTLP